MKKIILVIAKYGFLFVVISNLIAYTSLYFLNRGSFYKPQFLENAAQKTDFDYVIIGSSVGLTGLDSNLIDKLQNTNGINLCMDGTFLNGNYLMLQHFLALHKQTKNCILAVSSSDIENASPSLNLNDYRFLPNINQDYVVNYYQNNEKGFLKYLSFSKYFPAIAVGYYNTEIIFPALMAIKNPSYHNRFDSCGNFAYRGSSAFLDKKMVSKTISIRNPYLKKIQLLCQKNNIKLIVYLPPMYQTGIKMEGQFEVFLNFSKLITNKKYFYDPVHLNEKGRFEATQALAKEISFK